MPYEVIAFKGIEKLEENFENQNQAEARFDELKKQYDAVYIYDPNREMIRSYSDTYDGWEPQEAACGYCGSTCLDGYCWCSPDGRHHENYDF
jgi:hypothetical protein